MEVHVADTAGFCFGVQRAVDKVYDLIEAGITPIYTLGPLIHNEEVVEELASKGVQVLNEDEIESMPHGTVVIRSHGVGPQVYERIRAAGHETVDATCPFVLKIHRIVERESAEGRNIVITGDASHPEVKGIKGWCTSRCTCLTSVQDAMQFEFDEDEEVTVVSQTTFNFEKLKYVVEILEEKSYSNDVQNSGRCRILNTICNATEERQKEARQIAAAADTMLVIGSRHSSNTQKLYEICRSECANTYYIQTPVDLDSDMFQRSSYVGITAGASTPKKIILEVQKHVRENF